MADQLADSAIALSKKLNNNDEELAIANLNKAKVLFFNHNYNEASQYAQQAIQLFKKLNSKEKISESAFYLSGAIYEREGSQNAISYISSLIPEYRREKNYQLRGIAFEQMAKWMSATSKDSAIEIFNKAIVHFQVADDINGIAACNFEIGKLYFLTRDYTNAFRLIRNALLISEQEQSLYNIFEISNYLGNIYLNSGDSLNAVKYFWRCWEVAQFNGNKILEGESIALIGDCYVNTNNIEKGINAYKKSCRIYLIAANKPFAGIVSLKIALAFSKNNMPDSAIIFREIADRLFFNCDNDSLKALFNFQKGAFYFGVKQYENAIKYVNKAFMEHSRLNMKKETVADLLLKVQIEMDSVSDQNHNKALIKNLLTELNTGILLSKESNDSLSEVKFHEWLYEQFKNVNDNAAAFYHFQQFNFINNKLKENNYAIRLAALKSAFDVENYKLQMNLKEVNQYLEKISSAMKKNIRLLLLSIVGLVIFGSFIFLRIRK